MTNKQKCIDVLCLNQIHPNNTKMHCKLNVNASIYHEFNVCVIYMYDQGILSQTIVNLNLVPVVVLGSFVTCCKYVKTVEDQDRIGNQEK